MGKARGTQEGVLNPTLERARRALSTSTYVGHGGIAIHENYT